MNLKEIKELIDTLTEKDVAEFELERGNERIRIRRQGVNSAPQIAFAPVAPAMPVAAAAGTAASHSPAPSASAAAPAPAAEIPAADTNLHLIKSPIVGTYYDAPSPGAPPFVQPGDIVEAGQVLCIIEAMKLMNEIESEVAGVVEKRFVTNQQPVEYGEALFAIRPRN